MMINGQSQQIIGAREVQQDAMAQMRVSADCQLFVLADGMGGHNAGEVASQTTVDTFLAYFAHPIEHESPADALHTALLRANSAVQSLILQHPEWQGMGTTLLAVLLRDNGQFDYISVGDSPLYRLHSGSLKRINANHAFAAQLQQMVAAGTISAADAAHHPQRHAITSAIMGNTIAHIDQNSGSLNAGEWLILASDGIQTLSEEEMQTLSTTPSVWLHELAAKNVPHQDNASVMMLQYQPTREIESPDTLIPTDFRQPEKKPWHNSPSKMILLGMILAILLGLVVLAMAWGRADEMPAANASSAPFSQPETASSVQAASETASAVQ